MKMIFTILMILTAHIAWGDPECDYHFNMSNATLQISDGSQVVQQATQVNRGQNSPDGRCRVYRVFLSKGLANNYQRKAFNQFGESINYNPHSNINQAGVLKDFGDAVTANEFVAIVTGKQIGRAHV